MQARTTYKSLKGYHNAWRALTDYELVAGLIVYSLCVQSGTI
jgi:hypothetical protein